MEGIILDGCIDQEMTGSSMMMTWLRQLRRMTSWLSEEAETGTLPTFAFIGSWK